jgi:hypothetical protein
MSENENVDWQKFTEMQQKFDEIMKEKLARVRIFDPQELIKRAKEIREIYDEDLGTIRYVHLDWKELREIMKKYEDNTDRSIESLFLQLAPANPGMTKADVEKLPYDVVARLITKIQKDGAFFPPKPQIKSETGSTSTEQPKQSDS